MKSRWLLVALLIVALCFSGLTLAASYPTKPIQLIVPFGAGGATDLAARAMSAVLPKYIGQPVVVINKPGAGGSIGVEYVTRSKPDGYTMCMAAIASNQLGPAFNPNLPFKYDECTFVARVQLSPGVIAVKKDAPWKTVDELLAEIKKHPGTIMYGSSGMGSLHTMGSNLLLKAAKINLNDAIHIPFNSGAEQATAIIGGHTNFSYINLSEVISNVRNGDIRLLAVAAPKRLADFPDVPTFKEIGYPTVNVVGWRGVTGPVGLPSSVVKKWNDAIKKMMKDPKWIEMTNKIQDIPNYEDAKEFEKNFRIEFKLAQEVANEMGLMQKK